MVLNFRLTTANSYLANDISSFIKSYSNKNAKMAHFWSCTGREKNGPKWKSKGKPIGPFQRIHAIYICQSHLGLAILAITVYDLNKTINLRFSMGKKEQKYLLLSSMKKYSKKVQIFYLVASIFSINLEGFSN